MAHATNAVAARTQEEVSNTAADDESESGSSYSGSVSDDGPGVVGSRDRSRSPRGFGAGAGADGPVLGAGHATGVADAKPRGSLSLGMVVELTGLAKAPQLNGRRGVITGGSCSLGADGRWEILLFPRVAEPTETQPRRISVASERLFVPRETCVVGGVRMRIRNVPSEYDTDLLREELEDEGFVERESFFWLIFDQERRFGYFTAVSERVALQIIGQFDGRRLERAGPGGTVTESVLAQIVKLERL
eukprot:TRINITY_DN22938_c0_g1_i1.p1 TRINITY_DN22938_c0_g1~~TRINITY_DN22938_c0_g1_i1.p1  ORF type:complete len:259 (+),score=47.33 TRINITY_DN22938_c0_g1_i1:39-779(+)